MIEIFEILTTLFQPIGIALSMIYAYGFLARRKLDSFAVGPIMGALLGLAAIVSMMSPIEISDGVIIDARLVFIALSFGYFGPMAGAITFAMAIATRLYLGGPGVILGGSAILSVSLCALLWFECIRPRIKSDTGAAVGLATLVALHSFMGLLLPAPLRYTYIHDIVGFSFIVQFTGTFLLGILLTRERLHVMETRTLQMAARTDALTGIHNRLSIRDKIESLNRGPQALRGRALLLLDIDLFKSINDTHGHPVGDVVLVQFVARICNCLRQGDLFSRLGGDEFSILLPDTSAATAEIVADRCRQTISRDAFVIEDLELNLTVSIGVTWTPLQASFAAQSASADAALYRAKRKGRNYTVVGAPLVSSDTVDFATTG